VKQGNQHKVNVAQLPAGIYQLQVIQENEIACKRIVIE
ncbi:MAG: T9SS type A sorting domain-containing protein, partial [Bacteroidia bacterium]